MDVILHLGAHKTASTHLQNAFEAEAGRLDEAGVSYIPLTPLRREFSPLLWQVKQTPDRGAAVIDAREALNDFTGNASTLILSDENLLGLPLQPHAVNRFYPGVEANLSALLRVLDAPPSRLYIAIRCLDGFLASAYLERLRHHPFQEFEEFLGQTRAEVLLWSSLIRRVRAVLGGPPVTVWRYEDYASLAPEIVRRMTGLELQLSSKTVRPSLSAGAVQALRDLARQGSDAVTTKRLHTVIEQFPKDGGWGAYDPWSADDKARLRDRYAEDVARIGETEGVEVLTP